MHTRESALKTMRAWRNILIGWCYPETHINIKNCQRTIQCVNLKALLGVKWGNEWLIEISFMKINERGGELLQPYVSKASQQYITPHVMMYDSPNVSSSFAPQHLNRWYKNLRKGKKMFEIIKKWFAITTFYQNVHVTLQLEISPYVIQLNNMSLKISTREP